MTHKIYCISRFLHNYALKPATTSKFLSKHPTPEVHVFNNPLDVMIKLKENISNEKLTILILIPLEWKITLK